MTKITVYTTPNCPQCNFTKKALDQKGLTYESVDLTQDAEALLRIKGLGFAQAPVVEAGEDRWAGYQPDKIKQLALSLAA